MANANAGAIHALGYPLTSRYGIPHGLANALMAAAALEHTWPGRPERCAELARLLEDGPEDLAGCVRRLLEKLGVNSGLAARRACAKKTCRSWRKRPLTSVRCWKTLLSRSARATFSRSTGQRGRKDSVPCPRFLRTPHPTL